MAAALESGRAGTSGRVAGLEEFRRNVGVDPLTGLPNGLFFVHHLDMAMREAAETGGLVALFSLDLVGARDLKGRTRTAVLSEVADRLVAVVNERGTVARLDDDQFAVVVDELASEVDAVVLGKQMQRSISEAIRARGDDLELSSAIGIAVSGGEPDTPESVERQADVARLAAHRTPDGIAMFDPDVYGDALRAIDIEEALRAGLEHHQFVVHYQPLIELESGRLVGLEALVRWDRPDVGLMAPGQFLPAAEETGLILQIGREVLDLVLADARRWEEAVGTQAPTVWIDVSARQLADPEFAGTVLSAARQQLAQPSSLGVELTESDIVTYDDDFRRSIDDLVRGGVRVAIDDFGTGFASLSYLWRFPADVIKIDRSFVARLEQEREATVLIAAMIQLAHSLGKRVVAEGVETDEQLSRLRRLGCDAAQGYLLARPVPASEIDKLIGAVAQDSGPVPPRTDIRSSR